MGCWHGGHGCGPWYGPPYGPGLYGPADWEEELDRPIRRRSRRYARLGREAVAEELEGRLADLRDEVRRAELELTRLRDAEATATAEGP